MTIGEQAKIAGLKAVVTRDQTILDKDLLKLIKRSLPLSQADKTVFLKQEALADSPAILKTLRHWYPKLSQAINSDNAATKHRAKILSDFQEAKAKIYRTKNQFSGTFDQIKKLIQLSSEAKLLKEK